MAVLKLENLTKRYGNFSAVDDVTLEIKKGEIFGLLGASGSGKSTILKMIAGSETPSAGKIFFDNQDVTNFPAKERDVGVVLQNYPLFPQLNVFENVAFGLPAKNNSEEVVKAKITESLNLVKLSGFANRAVNELSGGQQQRVALARTIAAESPLLLFDEPLSNLEIGLREEIRGELRELIKRSNLTAVYVTQDQDEAFALCDRIAVINSGRVLQTDTPRQLYEQPASVAVASFLGRNNLIRATQLSPSENSLPEFQALANELRLFVDRAEKENITASNQIVTLAIRPEHVVLPFGAAFPEDNLFKAKVAAVQYFGATTRILLEADGLQIETVVLRLVGLRVGDDCMVSLPPNRILVLKN